MKGEDLKRMINEAGIPLTKVAEALGLSQQNLSGILSRDDIKTGTLEKISEVIGRPVSYTFGEGNSTTASGEHSSAVSVNGSIINDSMLIDEIAAQRRLTEQALSQNDRLIGIIHNLTKGE